MNKKAKYIIGILIGSIALIYFYTLLHEGGHALVVVMCGGNVDKLVLGINAHVQTSDTNFTVFTGALRNSAGTLLPVVFLIIALGLYKQGIKNEFYHIFYLALSLIIVCSLLAWIIVPMAVLFTLSPAGNDITKFLGTTGIHPLIVVFSAILIIGGLILLIYKKGLLENVKKLQLFQAKDYKFSKAMLIRFFTGIAVVVVIAVVGLNIFNTKPVFETSFSMEATSANEDVKLPFVVEKSKEYNMNLKLTAKGFLTDVQIYSEEGDLIYQDICEWLTLGTSHKLNKGNYIVVLTFLKNQAAMEEHLRKMGYKFEPELLEKLKEVYKNNSSIEKNTISFSGIIK